MFKEIKKCTEIENEELFPDIKNVFKRKKHILVNAEVNIYDDDVSEWTDNKRKSSEPALVKPFHNDDNKKRIKSSYLDRFSFENKSTDVNIYDDDFPKKEISKKCTTAVKCKRKKSSNDVDKISRWKNCSSDFNNYDALVEAKITTNRKRINKKCSGSIDQIDIEWKLSQSKVDDETEIILQQIDESSQCDTKIIPETPESTPEKLKLENNDSISKSFESNVKVSLMGQIKKDASLQQLKSPARGTNWIEQIPWQLKTPEKKCELPENLEDSGKKKKPIIGGFVEQLSKVIAREKSSQNMWRHKQLYKKDYNAKGVFTAKVLKIENDKGLYHAYCEIFKQETKIEDVEFEFCNLLLNQSINTRFKITPGIFLKIHPPWQKLKHSSCIPTILSFYYFEVVKNDVFNTLVTPKIFQKTKDVFFRWICPCQTSNISLKSCPLHTESGTLFSSKINTQKCKTISNKDSPNKGNKMSAEISLKAESPILRTIKCETPNSSPSCPDGKKENCILKEVEKAGGQAGQKCSVKVKGSVENISSFSKHFNETEVQYRILLKDQEETFCFIDLPTMNINQIDDYWSELIKSGAGCFYCFRGLTIVERTTYDKNQNLFKLINETSSKKCAQSFCYILKCFRGDSSYQQLK